MTIYIAPVVEATDSFGQWLSKTNQVIATINNSVVTVNSNTSVGNAAITGTFTADSYVTANAGSLFIGTDTANATINASAIIIQATSTANNIISPSGMLIDGTTAYTKTLISLNNTVITTANVNSNAAYFSDRVIIGNTYIYDNSIVINTANILNATVGSQLNVGAEDGNTYVTRDGIYIVFNDNLPAGDTNSYLTAFELNVGKVTTSNLNLTGTGTAKFFGNTEFLGTNNYFENGLLSVANTQTGNLIIYSTYNITPDDNWTSQLKIVGNGYNGGISLDSNGMWVGHNSSIRDLLLATNETVRLRVDGNSGNVFVGTGRTSASDVLHVNGAIRIDATGNTGYVRLVSPNTNIGFDLILPEKKGKLKQVLVIVDEINGILGFDDNHGTDKDDIDGVFRSVGVGVNAPGEDYKGELRAKGNVIAKYSDERLKEVLGPIENALDKVTSLEGFYYKGNEKAKELGYTEEDIQVGVSAQKVQQVLPQIVHPAPIDENYLTVQYEKLVPLLIEAIKELKAEVDRLKNGN
jgi:hypothetical protein